MNEDNFPESEGEALFDGNQIGSQFTLALKKFISNFLQSNAVTSLIAGANITISGSNGSVTISASGGGTSKNASGPGTNTTIAASLSPTKVDIASADFANGITYDGTNHKFVIVTAGQYSITGFLYYSNPSQANVSYQTMVYLNGSQAFAGYFVPPVTSISISQSVTKILNLSVGDYIELYGQTNSSSTNIVAGGLSYLSIAKV